MVVKVLDISRATSRRIGSILPKETIERRKEKPTIRKRAGMINKEKKLSNIKSCS